jgi:hypothetical protein
VSVSVSRRSPVDPMVTVLGGEGSPIDSASGGAPGSAASLAVFVYSGDDYYIEVADSAGTGTDRYSMSATFEGGVVPPPDGPAYVDPVDNSAQLTGYVTQDIVFDTDTDWLSAQLVVTLTAGTIYQDPAGGVGSPNPVLFALFPSLEFDTYVSNGVVGESVNTISAIDLNPGAPLECDTSGISIGWFTTSSDDIGELHLARITLSDDAAGTFHFRATASPAGSPALNLTGTMADGIMTAD